MSYPTQEGLVLYVNGELVDRDISPQVRGRDRRLYNTFMIGRANDHTSHPSPRNRDKLVIDEFKFWSQFKTGDQFRESGKFRPHY